MRNKLQSPVGLNPKGVGPKIFKNTMPFILISIVFGFFSPELSKIPLMNETLRKIFGYTLLALGIIMYLLTLKQFFKYFALGKLITHGVYSLSRNPLYVSWILFILPSIALITNNWTFLSAPIAMHLFFSMYIIEEEKNLLHIFGEEYNKYCSKVNQLIGLTSSKSK
jgi:protein-S-isoprenylcysteine O-methyltransferase Ste14